jgi:hypothetical protein
VYELNPTTLPARSLPSTDRLFRLLGHGDESYLVVRYPATDSFVSLPSAAAAGRRGALSPSGDRVLMTRRSDAPRQDGFVAYTLASGEIHWYEAPGSGEDRAVAMSPVSDVVASIATVRDGVAVDLTQLAGPDRRRLWSSPGGWSAETTIAWSPDGTLISATYLEDDEDEDWVSVVLDLDGTVITHLPATVTLPSSNGSWYSDRELFCVDSDTRLSIMDVGAGTRTTAGRLGCIPWAFYAGEFYCPVEQTANDKRTQMSTASLSMAPMAIGQPHPYLAIHPHHLMWSVDVARSPAATRP